MRNCNTRLDGRLPRPVRLVEEKVRLPSPAQFGSIFHSRLMARWPVVLVLAVLTLGPAPTAGAQEVSPRTNIKGALEDSIRLLMIEHAVRIGTQEKTRQMLGGPFFDDYHRSVRLPPTGATPTRG